MDPAVVAVAVSDRAPLVPRVIATTSQLDALAPEWEGLMAGTDGDEPMRSPGWVRAWWRCFGERRRLRVVSFRQGPRLVGVVPLSLGTAWLSPGLPVRRLEAVPSGGPIACGGAILERGLEAPVIEQLARLLAVDALGRWDELVMPAGSAHAAMVLRRAFAPLGEVSLAPGGGVPTIPLPASWDEYLAALPAARRRRLRGALRAFDGWTGGHAELRIARTERELATGAAVLRELAAAPSSSFHDEVLPELLRRGALELMWLSAHGEPVAALVNLVWRDRLYVCESHCRPALPRGVRAGTVIHALAIKRAIELRRSEIDLLAGAHELALAGRPIAELRVARRGAGARIRHMVAQLMMRRCPGPQPPPISPPSPH